MTNKELAKKLLEYPECELNFENSWRPDMQPEIMYIDKFSVENLDYNEKENTLYITLKDEGYEMYE